MSMSRDPALRRRFTPVDPRCAMELDEIAPSEWAKLEAATDEYIAAVSDQLDDCVAVLTAGLPDADDAEGTAGPVAAAALRLGALVPASLRHELLPCNSLEQSMRTAEANANVIYADYTGFKSCAPSALPHGNSA